MARILKIDLGERKKIDDVVQQVVDHIAGIKAQEGSLLSIFFGVQQEAQQISKSVGTIKRSLLSFDRINRLTANSSGTKQTTLDKFAQALKDEKAAKELGGVLGALALRYHSLDEKMANAGVTAESIKQTFGQLSWAALATMSNTVSLCQGLVGIEPAAQVSAKSLEEFRQRLSNLTGGLQDSGVAANSAANGVRGAFAQLWPWLDEKLFTPVQQATKTVFSQMKPEAQQAWGGTKDVFSDAGGFFKNTFSTAWNGVMDVFSDKGSVFQNMTQGVLSGFKQVVNGMINGINQVVTVPFSGVNDVFSKIKNFTINGKKPFANMNFSISMPKIPFLASGAVLPANKPFLAMVGDQKHGTNIEAPLETIEQAVANVMAEVTEAQMAGQNATVQVLRQILEAVLGISLDEAAIAGAAERYRTKSLVMTGGF